MPRLMALEGPFCGDVPYWLAFPQLIIPADRLYYRDTPQTGRSQSAPQPKASRQVHSDARASNEPLRSSYAEIRTCNRPCFADDRLLVRAIRPAAGPNAMPTNQTGRSSIWIRRREATRLSD